MRGLVEKGRGGFETWEKLRNFGATFVATIGVTVLLVGAAPAARSQGTSAPSRPTGLLGAGDEQCRLFPGENTLPRISILYDTFGHRSRTACCQNGTPDLLYAVVNLVEVL